jgi:hypothetical protein
MNKQLKEKLIKHHLEMRAAFPALYYQRWVEKAADEGWNEVVKGMKKAFPNSKIYENESIVDLFATLYYSAFESALNTFFKQCLDDSLTTVELCMKELQKVTASIKTPASDFSGTKPGV